VEEARRQHLRSGKKRKQDETVDALHQRQANSKRDHDRTWDELRQEEHDLEYKLEQQRQQLLDRQEKERQDHDYAWQVEPKQRQWNRSSQKVRVLRVQQARLMNAKKFEEAADTCRFADVVAAAETREQHFHLGNAYYRSRKLLDAKHSEELDTFEKAGDVRIGELKYTKEVCQRRFGNRDSALEVELGAAKDPERLWVLKHRNEVDPLVRATGIRPAKPFARSINVSEFNTLALPSLPALTGRRRVRRCRDQRDQK
jgi:hypothetical protein